MATPRGAITGAIQVININSQAKAAPPNQAIANTDTVQFKNNDPANAATVTFLGAGANVFSENGVPITTLTIPAASQSGALTPGQSNLTVDFSVVVGSNQGGPFSIQIGSGPLEIDIINTAGNTNLGTAAIPNNGTLFFNNQTSKQATVTFGAPNVLYDSNGNSVTSQSVAANTQGAVLTGKGTNKSVTYGVAISAVMGERRSGVGDGSDTIMVGST
jgi:hypothetical protein